MPIQFRPDHFPAVVLTVGGLLVAYGVSVEVRQIADLQGIVRERSEDSARAIAAWHELNQFRERLNERTKAFDEAVTSVPVPAIRREEGGQFDGSAFESGREFRETMSLQAASNAFITAIEAIGAAETQRDADGRAIDKIASAALFKSHGVYIEQRMKAEADLRVESYGRVGYILAVESAALARSLQDAADVYLKTAVDPQVQAAFEEWIKEQTDEYVRESWLAKWTGFGFIAMGLTGWVFRSCRNWSRVKRQDRLEAARVGGDLAGPEQRQKFLDVCEAQMARATVSDIIVDFIVRSYRRIYRGVETRSPIAARRYTSRTPDGPALRLTRLPRSSRK